ncbi:neurensin 1-like [Nelusetta ayraudi]|uniref:neurensin 1-like n=1 Tax=Nelusetta ayraudi TaxID=303726 RepID=UPI003F70E4DF
MALCSEACVPASAAGGESSGSEAGSSCLQFGVRSYLHHFYEECSSSMWEENQGCNPSQRSSACWKSAAWKVSLAVCVLTLTAGVAALSVGFSTPRKIESFGEGDLFFVDAQAASFNRGLRVSSAAGIVLSCLGSALALVGVVVWILQRTTLKGRLFHRVGGGERRGDLGETWLAQGGVVTKAPVAEEGNIPVTLSKVENVQPSS